MSEPLNLEFIPGHHLSYVTTRIEALCNGHSIGSGTGFIAKFADTYGLVTNWHVVAGKNPLTGKILSKTAAVPDAIRFHVTEITFEILEDGKHKTSIFFNPVEIPLYIDDVEVWFGSNTTNYRNDVALILLNDIVAEMDREKSILAHVDAGQVTIKAKQELPEKNIENIAFDGVSFFFPPVGTDTFILGYPNGIEHSGVFPIWKRASVASEPQGGIKSGGIEFEHVVYVDALTKQGMSGAPVISMAREGDVYLTDDGQQVLIHSDMPVFVGVYAGRDGITQDEYEFSLGRVWKAKLVADLFIEAVKNSMR